MPSFCCCRRASSCVTSLSVFPTPARLLRRWPPHLRSQRRPRLAPCTPRRTRRTRRRRQRASTGRRGATLPRMRRQLQSRRALPSMAWPRRCEPAHLASQCAGCGMQRPPRDMAIRHHNHHRQRQMPRCYRDFDCGVHTSRTARQEAWVCSCGRAFAATQHGDTLAGSLGSRLQCLAAVALAGSASCLLRVRTGSSPRWQPPVGG